MNEEPQLRHELDRATRAQELLGNELFREAFDTLRDRLTKELFDAPVRDKEGREQLWMMRKLLDGVEGHVKTLVQTGKLASHQLAAKQTMRQKLRELTTW